MDLFISPYLGIFEKQLFVHKFQWILWFQFYKTLKSTIFSIFQQKTACRNLKKWPESVDFWKIVFFDMSDFLSFCTSVEVDSHQNSSGFLKSRHDSIIPYSHFKKVGCTVFSHRTRVRSLLRGMAVPRLGVKNSIFFA